MALNKLRLQLEKEIVDKKRLDLEIEQLNSLLKVRDQRVKQQQQKLEGYEVLDREIQSIKREKKKLLSLY